MVEIQLLAQLLPPTSRHRAPAPVADPLVPGLEVVEGAAQQVGVRGPEHQVVELVLARALDDPVPHVVVDDLALAGAEAATGAGVHHDQPRRAEVAVEAPALTLALLVVLL